MSEPGEATDAGWPADPRNAETEKFAVRPSDHGEAFGRTTSTAVAPKKRDADVSSQTQNASLNFRLSIIIAELALGLVIATGILILLLMMVWKENRTIRNVFANDVLPAAGDTEGRDLRPASGKPLPHSDPNRENWSGKKPPPGPAARHHGSLHVTNPSPSPFTVSSLCRSSRGVDNSARGGQLTPSRQIRSPGRPEVFELPDFLSGNPTLVRTLPNLVS